MVVDDPYDISDDEAKKRSYREFVMDRFDEASLKDIETSLEKGKINSSNKKIMIEFLINLHKKISDIKANEYAYEGDNNLNINIYLSRIKNLLEKLYRI